MKFLLLIAKNVRRNPLRTSLTSLGTIVLVFVVTLVWSVLSFLDRETEAKSQNLKCIVTERWQMPSRLPFSYATALEDYAWQDPADKRPQGKLDNLMTWTFYGGTTDPVNRTPESVLFAIAMEPRKMLTMMEELDALPPDQKAPLQAAIGKMESNRRGIIVGPGRLKQMKLRIGDRFTITSYNYKGIDLEFEVMGEFPPVPRYDQTAVMNRDYLNDAFDAWPRSHNNQKHPMAERPLNLLWLRFPDAETFSKVATAITNSPDFSNPAVKCETLSSGVAAFLEAYRDLLFGMRWFLSPAILITLSLVISNAISISVRERRQELAVLKVLGFRPQQVMLLVLGEALLIGILSGALSSTVTFTYINYVMGGIKFPIAFFPAFVISSQSLWWGPAVGAGTALVGSFLPAWTARSVKVSEVFAKVA